MTDQEFADAYYRLVVQYGLPHKDGADNTDYQNEWRKRFLHLDAVQFDEAISAILLAHPYKSFPTIAAVKQQYDALSPAPSQKSRDYFQDQLAAIRRAVALLSREDHAVLENEVRPLVQKYWDEKASMFRSHFKNLNLSSETLFAEHLKLLVQELYARRHNMPFDFVSGLLQPADKSKTRKESSDAAGAAPISQPPVGLEVPVANETYFAGLGDRKEVMPVKQPHERLDPELMFKGGGRGYEKPAQRYQPPPEIDLGEEIPF